MFSSVVIIDYGIKDQLDSAKPILTKYIKVYEKNSRSSGCGFGLDPDHSSRHTADPRPHKSNKYWTHN